MESPALSRALRSGALAKATGLSADSIRHYERIGILPRAHRTQSGYRLFANSLVARVRVVQKALQFGFKLSELAAILRTHDSGGIPCTSVYQLAQEKLRKVKCDIESLKETEKQLTALVRDWEIRMKKSGSGQKAHLLGSLVDLAEHPAQRNHNFKRRNFKGKDKK